MSASPRIVCVFCQVNEVAWYELTCEACRPALEAAGLLAPAPTDNEPADQRIQMAPGTTVCHHPRDRHAQIGCRQHQILQSRGDGGNRFDRRIGKAVLPDGIGHVRNRAPGSPFRRSWGQ